MDVNLIKKEYRKKIKELNKHNKSYYDDNISLINDADYDLLKNEILTLEKKYNFLKEYVII